MKEYIFIEESRGVSQKTWDTMDSAEREAYIESHPLTLFSNKDSNILNPIIEDDYDKDEIRKQIDDLSREKKRIDMKCEELYNERYLEQDDRIIDEISNELDGLYSKSSNLMEQIETLEKKLYGKDYDDYQQEKYKLWEQEQDRLKQDEDDYLYDLYGEDTDEDVNIIIDEGDEGLNIDEESILQRLDKKLEECLKRREDIELQRQRNYRELDKLPKDSPDREHYYKELDFLTDLEIDNENRIEAINEEFESRML